MTRFLFILTLIFGLIFLNSCKQILSVTGSGPERDERPEKTHKSKGEHYEDLNTYRPQFEMEEEEVIEEDTATVQEENLYDSLQIQDTLNVMLDSIATIRLKKNKVQGYSILIHNGTNHEEALKVKGDLMVKYPDEYTELRYQQPFFRVKIGKFYKQLNAYALLEKVKRDYPKAIIVPSTFAITEEENER